MAENFILDLLGQVNEKQTQLDVEKKLKSVSDNINKSAVKPLQFVGTLNFNETKKYIENQLVTIGKGLNVNLNIGNSNVGKTASDIGNTISKTINNSVNAANGGLADTEKKIKQIELARSALIKQTEIMTSKANKSNIDIGSFTGVVGSDTVNYLDKFNSLIGSMNFDNVKEAGKYFQLIRLEFQKLNASMSSDLPDTALEGMSRKLASMPSDVTKVGESFKNLVNPSTELTSKVTDLKNLLTDVNTKFADGSTTSTEEKIKSYTKLKDAIENVNKEISAQKTVESNAKSSNKYSQDLKNIGLQAQTAQNRLAIFSQQLKKNAQVENVSRIREIENAYRGVTQAVSEGNLALAKNGFATANRQMQVFKTEMIAAGNVGDTFFTKLNKNIKQFVGFLSSATVVMQGFRAVEAMVDNVTKIDTAMVSLKKVTDETDASYNKFLQSASVNAKALGQDISDLVEQTATWAKLGYGLEDSQDLAKVSTVYANVGEVDNATAVSDLVTALKAFSNQGLEAIDVVDKLNNLSNKYAVSAADLGEGLKNSASSLALAGNSIDQSLSMITAMSEIIQDAGEAGNAVKILSMRLRGMKGELQDLGEDSDGIESISKIQTQLLNLTNNKVNIFDDNGNFKSTYEIMKSIAAVWKDINQQGQSQIIEIIAGKQRSNSISALLTNMSTAEKALADSSKSTGSAMAEESKWLESIEAKSKQLSSSIQDLSQTVVSSDLIKWIVDFGTSGVTALDGLIKNIGTLGVAFSGLMAYKGFKGTGIFNFLDSSEETGLGERFTIFGNSIATFKENIISNVDEVDGKLNKIKATFAGIKNTLETVDFSKSDKLGLQGYAKDLENGASRTEAFNNNLKLCSAAAKKQAIAISEVNNQYKTGAITQKEYNLQLSTLTQKSKLASIGVKALGVAMNMAFSMGISLIINAIITGMAQLVNSVENAKQHIADLADEYADANSKVEDANSKLLENQKTIDDINKNPLDYTREETKKRLEEENEQLRQELQWLKDIEAQKKKSLQSEAEKYFTSKNQESDLNRYGDKASPWANAVDFMKSSDEAEKSGNWGKAFKDAALAFMPIPFLTTGENVTPIEKSQEFIDEIKKLQEERKTLDLSTDSGNSRKSEIDSQIEDYHTKLSANNDELLKNRDNLDETSQAYKDVTDVLNATTAVFKKTNPVIADTSSTTNTATTSIEDLATSLSTLKDSLKDVLTNSEKFTSAMDKIKSGSSLTSDEMLALVGISPDLADDFTRTADGYTISIDKITEAQKVYTQANKDGIQSEIDKTKAVIAQSQAKINVLTKERNSIKVDNSLAPIKISDINKSIDEEKSKLGSANNLLSEQKLLLDLLENPFEEMAESAESLASILSELQSSYDLLNTAQEEYTNNQTLSLDTLQKISSQYPELENTISRYIMGLTDEQEVLDALKGKYNEDFLAYRKSIIDKIILTSEELTNYTNYLETKYGNSVEYYNQIGASDDDFVKYMSDNYDVDLKNCHTYAEAKRAMIAEMQASVFNANGLYDFEKNQFNQDAWSEFIGSNSTQVVGYVKSIFDGYEVSLEEFGNLAGKFEKSAGLDIDGKLNNLLKKDKISSDTTKSTTEKVFDWVEVKLENLKKKTKQFVDSISDYISDKVNNGNINKALSSVGKEITAQNKAIQVYSKKANSVGLSSGWKKKVQDGNYSISTIKDETLANKITEYQQWWDKIVACKDELKSLKTQELELKQQKIDLKVNSLTFATGQAEQKTNSKTSAIDLKVSQGKVVTEKDYSSVISSNKSTIKALETEKTYYTKLRNASVKGSAEWRKWQEQIDTTTNSITSAKQETEDLIEKQRNLSITKNENNVSAKQTAVSNAQNTIDFKESQGRRVTTNDYQNLIKASKNENTALITQKKNLIALQKQTRKGSEKWQEYQDKIEGINSSIKSNLISQEEWNDSIRDLPMENIQKYLDTVDKVKSYWQQVASTKETVSGESSLTASDYNKQKFTVAELYNQQGLVDKYKAEYDKAMAGGRTEDAKKYKDLWNEAKTEQQSMLQTNEELRKQARDVTLYGGYEKDLKNIQVVKTALENLQSIINDDGLYNEDGSFNEQGLSKVAVTVSQLEQAKAEQAKFAEEIRTLEKNKSQYNTDDYNAKLEELTKSYNDAGTSVKNYSDQIIEMYKNQSKAELDALNKVIESRSEALKKKKEYYDYDKTIKSKSKDINALKMQAEALTDVNTSEAKAQKARLAEEIAQAEQELADTQTEHIYSMQVEGFDNLKTDLQECYDEFVNSLNTCLDVQGEIIKDATALSEQSAKLVKDTLNKMAAFYGIDLKLADGDSKNIPHFASGGIVAGIKNAGDDGLASLKVGETVMSEKFTQLLPQATNVMENFIKNIKVPNFNYDFKPKNSNSGVTNIVNYDSLIRIDGNVDKYVIKDLKDITKEVGNALTKDLIKKGYSK